jgi:hypothetical protein
MNRNLIIFFAFALLATLSIVSAIPTQFRKRVTTFKPCAKAPPIDVTEIEPNPLVPGGKGIFHVTGSLAKNIPEDSIFAAIFLILMFLMIRST